MENIEEKSVALLVRIVTDYVKFGKKYSLDEVNKLAEEIEARKP